MTSSLLDTALDLSVVGSTSGVGLAPADGFARLGATVWLAVRVRDRDRGEQARARMLEPRGEADIRLEVCDLSRLEPVRRFAERFTAPTPRLDVLVNHAGVLTHERQLSGDAIELTLATNVIGPFLLTQARQGGPRRAVGAATGRAPAPAHAMHAGWADTARRPVLAAPLLPGDPATAAQSGSGRRHDRVAGGRAEPAVGSGGIWHDRRRRRTRLFARNAETVAERCRLWAECVALSSTSST